MSGKLPFALAMLAGTAAHAGAIFVTDGIAIHGYDPVAYFTEHRPVKGSPEHAWAYRGATFWFASDAHRAVFQADPDHYAPRYGGFCAFAAANGAKATTEPDDFTILGDRLYLNHDDAVQSLWRKDAAGNVAKADARWPTVESQPDP